MQLGLYYELADVRKLICMIHVSINHAENLVYGTIKYGAQGFLAYEFTYEMLWWCVFLK